MLIPKSCRYSRLSQCVKSSKTVVCVIKFFINLAIMMVCDSPGGIYLYCFQLVDTNTVTQHTVGVQVSMYKYNHLLSHHISSICNHNAFVDGIVCMVKYIYQT